MTRTLGPINPRPAIRGALIASSAAVLFAPSSTSARAVSRLSTARPAVLPATVDCSTGAKIQTAINAAVAGDIIVVLGVCVENISVPDEAVRITIDGQGTGAIRGASAGAATITVLGRNITIKRLTITGGRQGISVLRGGSALIDGNTIQQAVGNGVSILQNGHARLVSNTIQLNGLAGIGVLESSIARIGFLDTGGPVLPNVIRGNGAEGVGVFRGSSATILGNYITDNNGPGVLVSGTSNGLLAGNHIDSNNGDGVAVRQNSDVQLGEEGGIFDPPNETTKPNGGAGLRCSLNGSVNGTLGTLLGDEGPKKFDSTCAGGPKIK